MLPDGTSFDDVARRFAWQVPAGYNIGVDACDGWAEREPARLALIEVSQSGEAREFSFAELRSLSNRYANLLAEQGVARGEQVGILLARFVPGDSHEQPGFHR